ncbi:MAG: hypothetical protein JHD37_02385 [Ilumatobacteraceae bacterium]|nr:hypothetical protein [Ilumatobacteraceae bacterium]MBJ7508075.1 hypothetical protein [Ilumatobacteraceae bacterium]
MAILSYLRTRSLKEGLLRGRRGWFAIGVVLWTVRLVRRISSRSPQIVSKEILRAGESVSISSLEREGRSKRRARKSLS